MTKKEMFKANVQIVEIEPHSYCNRKCWFCPNSFIDRTGPVKHIDNKVYWQLLKDLESIGYDETICFAGWSEPFSHPAELLLLVKQARQMLPNALLMTNTNTDYLFGHILRSIAHCGLQVVKAQLYFDEEEEFCEDAIREKMRQLQRKLPDISFKEMSSLNWFALVNDSMVINAYARNFREMGVNRCDMKLRDVKRSRVSHCLEPIQMVGVNHNGWVVPCCNIRSDYAPHKPYLLGKMTGNPGEIFDLYEPVLLDWKKYPCKHCMFKQVGKMQHANIKLMFRSIIEDMKWRTRLVLISSRQSGQGQPVQQIQS